MTDHSRFLLGFVAFILLIASPLLVYLRKRVVSNARMILYFFIIYLLWYLPYAPIHEGAHYLGGRITGLHASSYQLLPHFWRGDFVNGYIKWIDGRPWQILLSSQAPYTIDGLVVVLGCLLLRKRIFFGPFLSALILTEVFLRSVFDVAVNYFAGTLARTGDFHYMLGGYPAVAVHLGAWAVMLLGAWGAVRMIMKARALSADEPR